MKRLTLSQKREREREKEIFRKEKIAPSNMFIACFINDKIKEMN